MKGAHGSESRKKRCGSTKVGGLGQGVALDRTIATELTLDWQDMIKREEEGFVARARETMGQNNIGMYTTRENW